MTSDTTQAIEAAARADAREFTMLFPDEKPSDGWLAEAYASAAAVTQWPKESRALYQRAFLGEVQSESKQKGHDRG
jgi:hypothetical protein